MSYQLQGALDQANFANCTTSNFANSFAGINVVGGGGLNLNVGGLNVVGVNVGVGPNNPATLCPVQATFYPNNTSTLIGGGVNTGVSVGVGGGGSPMVTATRTITQSAASNFVDKSTTTKLDLPSSPPPKKPLTPYMIYMKEMRPEVSQQNPNLRVTDVVKRVAAMWQSLDQSQKQVYVDRFKHSLEAFNKINEAYNSSLTNEQKLALRQQRTDRRERLNKRRLTTQLRELEKPKGARSAFSLFIISRLPNRGDIPMTEFTKESSEAWKALTDETKQIFFANAREDKLRHEREMSEWRQRMEREGHHDVIKAVFKDDKPGGGGKKTAGGRKMKSYDEDQDQGREYLSIIKYPPPPGTDFNNYK